MHAADPAAGRIEAILVDHEISPSQARNLEKEIGAEVMDRTMVILEIFHRHASSRAARAQVEIARLGYMAPRLREMAKLAGPQGRQRSGTGGRGAGESHTEMDRRKIRDRIAELQQEIEAMDVERKTQRARRQERQGLATVALVGYTNAGKSTLMRALTGSDVLVENKLFATLDTTVRALQPESRPRVLVSDTVGFIKNLPHGLVASFKTTLEEALDAALLLHVIDASDPGCERQREVTEKVLAEIGAQDVPRLRIFNKIDHVEPHGDAQARQRAGRAARRSSGLHRDERAPRRRRGQAARGHHRLLPPGSERSRDLPALVGAAAPRPHLRQLRSAGRARRRSRRHPAPARRSRHGGRTGCRVRSARRGLRASVRFGKAAGGAQVASLRPSLLSTDATLALMRPPGPAR
jgi:GTP-binding protein HflX